MPLKEEAGNSGGLQRYLGDIQGEHHKSQNPTRT